MNLLNLQSDPRDPRLNEEITHCDEWGEPTGIISRVQQVLSSDHNVRMYEVLDDHGHVRVVAPHGINTWIEVTTDG